eukprot:scaffold1641_cov108-Skeletonema_dohrnii-CCMP3373.AAC.1
MTYPRPSVMEIPTKQRTRSARLLLLTTALVATAPPQAASFSFSFSVTKSAPAKTKLQKSSHHHRPSFSLQAANTDSTNNAIEEETVDIAIVGAGIGGLCAGAILNTLYGKKVGVYESHYLAGGCAHAFERVVQLDDNEDGNESNNDDMKKKKKKVSFTFDSGPTIVLRAVGVDTQVEWIPYNGWGMIEHPFKRGGDDDDDDNNKKEKRWKLTVGPDHFENGPLTQFASSSSNDAIKEFNELREITKPLVTGAATIPAMAMRTGSTALIPLLRYLP